MAPLESIVETCRYREDLVFVAVRGVVTTPTTRFLDGDGTHLGHYTSPMSCRTRRMVSVKAIAVRLSTPSSP
jgi:hypothetical protein